MRKVWVFASLFCLIGVGCQGDPREAQARNVLTSLNTISSLTAQVKTDLTELVKKDKIDKDTDDIFLRMIEEKQGTFRKLKDAGKELQTHYRVILKEVENRAPNKEEMEKYQKVFGGQLESTLKQLDKETKDMLDAMKELERKHADVASELNKRLRDANTQYQQILGGG